MLLFTRPKKELIWKKVAAIFENVDIILAEEIKGSQPKIEVVRAEKGRRVTTPEKT